MSPPRLADIIDFGILGPELALDVERSVARGLEAGSVFDRSANALEVLRDTVSASIRDIETHPRGQLLQRFLREGPYERDGPIPPEARTTRLSDEEAATAVRFVYCFMVNSFQGALAELLALAPCVEVMERLRPERRIPRNARLYLADAARAISGGRSTKAADLHILAMEDGHLLVAGVAEVKSYSRTWPRVTGQLGNHLRQAALGLHLGAQFYPADRVTIGGSAPAARIGVLPSRWRLSRRFHFEPSAIGRDLHTERRPPPVESDLIERLSDSDWRITLRWSQEALAEAAYAMTFWYMEAVGEVVYASGVPTEWSRMTPPESGINAAKMMLYHAIPRARTSSEYQRAVALYNTYCFGYPLGMNFRDARGRREMLWPADLDEIAARGVTKHGCRIL
jgi:hypothetical protein